MLSTNARKDAQIATINRHEEMLHWFIQFADGDETALDKLKALRSQAGALPSTDVVIERAEQPAQPSNVIQMQAPVVLDPCQCRMAVKDQESSTHLCLVCGKNAISNYYVWAASTEGKALLKGEDITIDTWHEPVADSTILPPMQVELIKSMQPSPFVAAPAEFKLDIDACEDYYGEETA